MGILRFSFLVVDMGQTPESTKLNQLRRVLELSNRTTPVERNSGVEWKTPSKRRLPREQSAKSFHEMVEIGRSTSDVFLKIAGKRAVAKTVFPKEKGKCPENGGYGEKGKLRELGKGRAPDLN